ncbi:MAG: hypothetical protein WCJ48_04960 [Actinomycetes bacterium]|jgi:hypothetical protein
MSVPSAEELTALAQQIGMSRGDLEAFVEAWSRAGMREPLTEFLGITDSGDDSANTSHTA